MTQEAAEEIAALARDGNRSIAVAESLTGGQLTARLAAAPDASEWFRGGVVAYNSEVKRDLLGVPPGPVVNEVAATAMARGATEVLGADLAVSTTGVGGPDEEEGLPPGTVWIAVAGRDVQAEAWPYAFGGDPSEICRQTCDAALARVLERLRGIA